MAGLQKAAAKKNIRKMTLERADQCHVMDFEWGGISNLLKV